MNQATSQNPCRLVPLYRQDGNSDAANTPRKQTRWLPAGGFQNR
ncbi:MAG: hypothetical protein VB877_17935 [Pirellulaceae bacterium]